MSSTFQARSSLGEIQLASDKMLFIFSQAFFVQVTVITGFTILLLMLHKSNGKFLQQVWKVRHTLHVSLANNRLDYICVQMDDIGLIFGLLFVLV